MRPSIFYPNKLVWCSTLICAAVGASIARASSQLPRASDDEPLAPVSVRLFSSLERMSRIVDISYCVGVTGVSKPFSCVSRCKEFPTLTLVKSWNTGVLMTDSCGYIAVDHGTRRPDVGNGDERDDIGERAIIVAFRGTYSITNTVIDLGTIPQEYVPYPSPDDGGDSPKEPKHKCTNCTVHMGFLTSWRAARTVVLPELKALRESHPDYPVYLVGHSLGGAVAMLAALELKVSLEWDDIVVTTFGEPRVGNQGLSDYVDAVFDLADPSDLEAVKYRRVTHHNDPVPLLPLSEWGYSSHGGEFFISKDSLSPSIEDVSPCIGDHDNRCSASGDMVYQLLSDSGISASEARLLDLTREMVPSALGFPPSRYKLWQLFFAHRDYFWRLGLCVPGGDPANWGRDKYGKSQFDEL
jgi:pimeloyl-ACP methyl ester carboxylesterase